MPQISPTRSELKSFSLRLQFSLFCLAVLVVAGGPVAALTAVRKPVGCALMLSLSRLSSGEELMPLLVRLEERVKFAGRIPDDGVTDYRPVQFNGSLEAMAAASARDILHRLEGLRESLRSHEAFVEEPIILRGENLRHALRDLPGELARASGENGIIARLLRARQFDRELPALVGTLQDMLDHPAGEPLRFASSDFVALEPETVRADGAIEPASTRHVLADHIAFRDDGGEVVWIFICRKYFDLPQGREPRRLREEAPDFSFLPQLGPAPVLVPARVRK